MDWQSGVAAGLGLLGGGWALWTWVRPFMRSEGTCGPCGGCQVSDSVGERVPLVQIEPLVAQSVKRNSANMISQTPSRKCQ